LGSNKNKDEDVSESVSTTSNTTEETKNEDVTETTNESKSISTSYVDNQIGDTVNANGLEITVNSIQPVKTWSDNDSYELSISFKNNTNKSISLSPYDWHSVSDNGNDVAYVGGDGSFNIKSLKKGEAWDAKLTLWNKNAIKIKYDSKLTEDNAEHPYITWVIPGVTVDEGSIVLVSEVLGEYGRLVILNESTDMPAEKYLYKIPSGKYKVTTLSKKAAFAIVKDEIAIEEGNDDYPECLDYVTEQFILTNKDDDDLNGHAEKDVIVEVGEDESVSIPLGGNEIVFKPIA
jgi:hypothetical protein